MKEFENQFGEDCAVNVSCGTMSCIDCKNISAFAWKAALEWALDSAGGNCDWDKIEGELEK